MPVFVRCWPNGDVSFVSARNKEDAIIMVEEWGNASAQKKKIREAVQTEKPLLAGKKMPKAADTGIWQSFAKQLNAPAALINRRIKEVATEALQKSPNSGHKQ